MKRLTVAAAAVSLFAFVMTWSLPAQAGGRHRGGSAFFGAVDFTGYPSHTDSSFFFSGGSIGFSFFTGSRPPHRYGYGPSHRGHRFYHRQWYRREGHALRHRRPPGRHGSHYRSGGGIGVRIRPGFYAEIPFRGTRVWVPGRMTPRGYVRGYWDYR